MYASYATHIISYRRCCHTEIHLWKFQLSSYVGSWDAGWWRTDRWMAVRRTEGQTAEPEKLVSVLPFVYKPLKHFFVSLNSSFTNFRGWISKHLLFPQLWCKQDVCLPNSSFLFIRMYKSIHIKQQETLNTKWLPQLYRETLQGLQVISWEHRLTSFQVSTLIYAHKGDAIRLTSEYQNTT